MGPAREGGGRGRKWCASSLPSGAVTETRVATPASFLSNVRQAQCRACKRAKQSVDKEFRVQGVPITCDKSPHMGGPVHLQPQSGPSPARASTRARRQPTSVHLHCRGVFSTFTTLVCGLLCYNTTLQARPHQATPWESYRMMGTGAAARACGRLENSLDLVLNATKSGLTGRMTVDLRTRVRAQMFGARERAGMSAQASYHEARRAPTADSRFPHHPNCPNSMPRAYLGLSATRMGINLPQN